MRAPALIAAVLVYVAAERLLTPRICDRLLGEGAWRTLQDELSNRRTSP